MPRKAAPSSVADKLHELQSAAARSHHAAREADVAAHLAMASVVAARNARVEAHADRDPVAVKSALTAYQEAEEAAADTAVAAEGAQLAAERAQRAVDAFTQEHAHDLLEERASAARELALNLTRTGPSSSSCTAATSPCAPVSTRWSEPSRTRSLARTDLPPPIRGSVN